MKNIKSIRRLTIILIVTMLLFCLAGCGNKNLFYIEKKTESVQGDIVTYDVTNEGDESYTKEYNSTVYVLNVHSKKIHKKTCGTGDLILPENRKVYKGDIKDLYEQGYTRCGNCFRGEE